MIKLKNIEFSYAANQTVFSDFNFNWQPGDRLGLVGSNGCGKTTLFKLITGLLTPSQGEIIIFDQSCQEEKDFTTVREQVGFLFQEPANQLFCPTVEEELAFGPLNLGRSQSEVDQLIESKLDLLDIKHLRSQVPWQLSGGEQRLVALAAVLTMEPEVILLDEPFSGLDQAKQENLLQALNQLQTDYIIASHNQDLMSQVVDKFYYLEGDNYGIR